MDRPAARRTGDLQEGAVEVRVRAEGLASLIAELRQHDERKAGMMEGVETRLDASTLIVRIPMRFQRRGGRKRVVVPDGREIVPTSRPQPEGTLVKALARAHGWQRGLESGEYGTLADLADAERISRSYVCRVLRLTLLAPAIVERILDGGPTAGLAQLLKPFPVEWEQQRKDLL
jgi:hypothetical protein